MPIPCHQHEVATFLRDLSDGRLKETHISAVFLGRDTVWKLKKAVELEFLDFSTLDARRHFLLRELQVNKAAAPRLYRDVVPIIRTANGALAFGDPGDAPEALDWVLRMAPVPDADFLDAIAERGELTPRLLDAIGDCVALYHARLPPVAGWDSHAALLRLTAGNARSAMRGGLPSARVDAWRQDTETALTNLAPWLAERSARGFVRRCHGDLHLGNLCMWEGQPVPFDALEFDEAMATIDVGYDLAFLLMDLDHRVSRMAANRVMNRAMARSGDTLAVTGFPAFLSQRAMVRAHVSAASGRTDDAAAYLEAAEKYLVRAPALVLAIGGLPGSGKSTLARLLAPGLGAPPGAVILRSDEIRKRLHGTAPETRLPQSAYSQSAGASVNAALVAQIAGIAQAGHAVILDATFLDPALRQAVATAAKASSVRFVGAWLNAPMIELRQRISLRRDDASDATLDVLHRAAAAHSKPDDWLQVDARDIEAAASQVRLAVAPPRAIK